MDARTVLGDTGAAQCFAVLFDADGPDRPVGAVAVRRAALTHRAFGAGAPRSKVER